MDGTSFAFCPIPNPFGGIHSIRLTICVLRKSVGDIYVDPTAESFEISVNP